MMSKLAWWNYINWDFLYTKKWAIFINVVRIGTFILMIYLIHLMASNIEEVKILGTDACRYCTEKTGAICQTLRYGF